jgi:hypothetical protein
VKKVRKLPGRWSTKGREDLGITFTCPNCSNHNPQPVLNAEGKPYCSSCLIKFGKVFIMKKRKMYSYNQRRPRR